MPAWVLVSVGPGNVVNNDIVVDFNSVSADGNKIVFSTWSTNGMGLGGKTCSYDSMYVRDVKQASLAVAVTEASGLKFCGYEPAVKISGNGEYVFFRGQAKRFATSPASTFGFWRARLGTPGFELVNVKGLEFSFEYDGSIKVGETIKGEPNSFSTDHDGNSVVFSMKYLENTAAVPRQYNSTIFDRAMLRMDKGAQVVGNQDLTKNHSSLDNTFDVSSNGGIVIFSETDSGRHRYEAWDMLAHASLGPLFSNVLAAQPTANFTVCGVSQEGRYVLVSGDFKVPLNPSLPTQGYAKLYQQLARYDRIADSFTFVGISEETSAARSAQCNYDFGGGLERQMSNDGNRIAWYANGFIYIRDIAAGRTVKITSAGWLNWVLSGDGNYIVFMADKSPDGTVYLTPFGSKASQIYRYGPLPISEFGEVFSLATFDAKLLQ